jgi:hypothetical protein
MNIKQDARRVAVAIRNRMDHAQTREDLPEFARFALKAELVMLAESMADLWYKGTSPSSAAQRNAFLRLATGDYHTYAGCAS